MGLFSRQPPLFLLNEWHILCTTRRSITTHRHVAASTLNTNSIKWPPQKALLPQPQVFINVPLGTLRIYAKWVMEMHKNPPRRNEIVDIPHAISTLDPAPHQVTILKALLTTPQRIQLFPLWTTMNHRGTSDAMHKKKDPPYVTWHTNHPCGGWGM